MSIADETTLRVVLYEGEDAQALSAEERCASLTALLEKGYSVTCAGNGEVAPSDGSALLVLGRFENGNVPQGEDTNGQVPIRFRTSTSG